MLIMCIILSFSQHLLTKQDRQFSAGLVLSMTML